MALTFSITGGADAAKFTIGASSGALAFKTAPDFEQPGDADANNIYVVEVGVSDGVATTKQTINVTVTDMPENLPPQITSPASAAVKEGDTVVMTVTATDPDAGPIPPNPTFTWPNASNTGVPAGTTLTAYTGPTTIQTNGTVIQNKRITVMLAIVASDVRIERCEIQHGEWWGINSDQGTRLTVRDCTFKGPGTGGQMAAAVLGDGTFERNNVSGTSFGFNCQGKSTVKFNYIHDLGYAGGDPHYDGIMCQGGNSDTLIEDNFVQTPASGGTAGMMISTEFGNISNVTVNHNRFLGSPSYQAYAVGSANNPNISGVVFTNNEMERGAYGYWVIERNMPVRTGNKDAFTGASIDNA